MARRPLEDAYPEIQFQPKTHNWYARLRRLPAECVHLEYAHAWMASFNPDRIYLRGAEVRRPGQRRPARPEVSLCRECLLQAAEPELAGYAGRVVAFEPAPDGLTQYCFVAGEDFPEAGLRPEIAAALDARLQAVGTGPEAACEKCGHQASWLWLSFEEAGLLDEAASITGSRGRRFCARHGAQWLCDSFRRIHDANLLYLNLPYGDSGAYLWI